MDALACVQEEGVEPSVKEELEEEDADIVVTQVKIARRRRHKSASEPVVKREVPDDRGHFHSTSASQQHAFVKSLCLDICGMSRAQAEEKVRNTAPPELFDRVMEAGAVGGMGMRGPLPCAPSMLDYRLNSLSRVKMAQGRL